jgi:hypothetical protein
MADKFQVHGLAAAKKRQPGRKPDKNPVKVTKVNPAALKLAHEMTKDTDTHIEIRNDGSIIIKNGKKRK